jgi:hypothetical protein
MIDINDYEATKTRSADFIAIIDGCPVRGTALMHLETVMANMWGSCTNAQPGMSKSPTETPEELRDFFLKKAAFNADAALTMLNDLIREVRDVKAIIATEV